MNEDTIRRYKSNIADEIEPAISELIQRAEQGLASLEKHEELLKTKVNFFFFFWERSLLTSNKKHIGAHYIFYERQKTRRYDLDRRLEPVQFRNLRPENCKL